MRRSRREPLQHNTANGVTIGIWREWYRGATSVVKHIGPRTDAPPHWQPSDDPTHWNYWRREPLAYQSGLPHRLGLAAPELLDRVVGERGGIELKLEDVEGRRGGGLTLDDSAAAARALGISQGSLRRRADDAWLSQGFLRAYATSKPFDRGLLDDDTQWEQPLVEAHLARLRPELVALRDRSERYFALVETLPRAVCHLDVWMNNLIRRPDGEVVFLDWAFAGDGALGEDPSNLVIDSVMDLLWPAERLDELDDAVFQAYRDGLREAGWRGDDRLVRLGMCAAAVKYEWLPCVMLLQPGHEQQSAYGTTVPADALFAARGAGLALVARYAAEADALSERLRR